MHKLKSFDEPVKGKRSIRGKHAATIRRLPLADLKPSLQNDVLYRPVDTADPDLRALADSIWEFGIREPLVVSRDGYILSGHRRHVAARIAGLVEVPCRVEPILYADTDDDDWIRLLREHNRQRIKSRDELLREEVVSADPHVAYERLLEHRHKKSDMSDFSPDAITMTGRRARNRISGIKGPMLDAILSVIQARRAFWPLSDRQIHYVLLNNPPLRNARRPDSVYANNRVSYQDLCDLLTRARLRGLIPWQAIADETRPITRWQAYANSSDYIHEQLGELFQDYARDLQRTQPCHIEIVAEKLTVKSIVTNVAMRYCLPVTIGRGYCSIVPRHEMACRYRASGKDKLVILSLSDLDPDGESIAETFPRSMRDDFHIANVHPIKVAITPQQVRSYGLKPQMQAKQSSAQYGKFVNRHGTDVFELEALPPETLANLLATAIDSVLDLDALNAEIDAEREDAAFLDQARQRAMRALRGL